MSGSKNVLQFVPQILKALPAEWRGTTFANSNLLGREEFSRNFVSLLSGKTAATLSTSDLVGVGNAEDYFRVASNISTLLELCLAQEHHLDVSQVFTFSSRTMPIIAVLLTTSSTVHLYTGSRDAVFAPEQQRVLGLLGCRLVQHSGTPQPHPNDLVLVLQSEMAGQPAAKVDAVVGPHLLLITSPQRIRPADILVVRKRMATPVTTPVAETMLQQLAQIAVTTDLAAPAADKLSEFYDHLQTLCGTAVNHNARPVVCTAGLSALAALFLALISRGGADVLMCSTAYGGSSQLTEILVTRTSTLHKHTFDIQGDADIVKSIDGALCKLAQRASSLAPTTVLFVEIPTNPDMKVPDLAAVASMLQRYKDTTGKAVLLLVDNTFSPNSQVMRQVKEITPSLPVMAFISMSKSISRGKTTAGAIVANHADGAVSLLRAVADSAALLDTGATNDQLQFLVQNHTHVEERTEKAYAVAATAAETLRDAVQKHTGQDMLIRFVSPEHARLGFTSSTFSFNLPSPANATPEVCDALAQRFVDLLCVHPTLFKPCVSFGQDNGLVYCTVPATSTQGAIKAEDKAKQAVGGVQLTRLSFPPTCEQAAVLRVINEATATIYGTTTTSSKL